MQSADMAGMVAIVTGGRVRIGYATVLKLLRAGAHVLTTSRSNPPPPLHLTLTLTLTLSLPLGAHDLALPT